jgi:hypothetical protein
MKDQEYIQQRLNSIYKLLANPLIAENPEQALREAVIELREYGFNDAEIVCRLDSRDENNPGHRYRLNAMSEISPHISQTQGTPTPWLQEAFLTALTSEQPYDNFSQLITELMEKVDGGGLIVELTRFLLNERANGNINEDPILDNMDRVVGW